MRAIVIRAHARRQLPSLVAALALAVIAAGSVSAAQRGELPRYRFSVEIEGLALATFTSVSGLSVETEVLEFREGGDTGAVRKIPGRLKYPNIVLKAGFTGDTTLFDWAMTAARTGDVVRRTVVISMVDGAGSSLARWRLHNAWPVKWEGPSLKASGNEVAIETLEIAHEGLTLDDDDDDR